jgi:hypothetical protein
MYGNAGTREFLPYTVIPSESQPYSRARLYMVEVRLVLYGWIIGTKLDLDAPQMSPVSRD